VASSSRRDRLLWVAGGAAALAVLFVQTWTRAHRPGGIDLTTYLEAARAIRIGQNPYTLPLPFPYIYPPFVAFALIPLAYIPGDVALFVWFAASVAALWWSTRQVLTLAYPELRARSFTPFLVALFGVTYTVLQSNLRNGQVNPIVIALAVGALTAYSAGRPATPKLAKTDARERRRDAALCWAAAIAIKIVPATLAPFYVRRGEWRVCGLAFVAFVALCLVPAVTLGAQVVSLNRAYVTAFLAGSFGGAGGGDALDFSLGGVLALISGVDGPWLRAFGAMVPIAGAFAADVRAPQAPRTDAIAFALYLAVIPLASPKSEVHHLAFALPGAALAFAAWRFGLEPPRLPLITVLGITVASYLAALVATAWSGPLFFVSLTGLAGALVLLLRYTPAASPPMASPIHHDQGSPRPAGGRLDSPVRILRTRANRQDPALRSP
jgi:hypothetical protein